MSEIKNEWQGFNTHRYKSNPLEKSFALAWQKLNDRGELNSLKTIDYILSNTDDLINICSNKDQQVASTIIQWLGSPCGQNFLEEVKNTKIKLDDLKIGDIICICKHNSGFQHMITCEYLGLIKGIIQGKVISTSPDWASSYYLKSSTVTCIKKMCSIYKEDNKNNRKRTHWLNPKTLEFE